MFTIAYDTIYTHPLPDGHRFPMLKYELIPQQLLHEGVITREHIFAPNAAAEQTIMLTHEKNYWQKMQALQLTDREMRAIGFPLSAALVSREITIMQGTVDCSINALQHGVSLNVAGGTHHAFAARGEGFCLLNDFAIAANYLLSRHLIKRAIVIDLDVHQGNGTAALFSNNDKVFTFSMHGAHNYPFRKETSDLDIGLPDGISGNEYLAILNKELPVLLEKVKPDIAFYLSGVDVLETDKFGKMKLSINDCQHRDEIVFAECHKRGIPVAVAMGGGYSPDIRHIITAHCNTFKAAKEIYGL